MTLSGSRRSKAGRDALPSPEEYAAFIEQLELLDVWLVEGQAANRHGPRAPRQAVVEVETPEATWVATSDGFDVRYPYQVRFVDEGTVHAEIALTLGLHFSSGQQMTAPMFRVFNSVNLPINTWPFLREFVSAMVGRMGWQSFTLPTLKPEPLAPPEDNEDDLPAPPARRGRGKKAGNRP
jgi:hypothetical protein